MSAEGFNQQDVVIDSVEGSLNEEVISEGHANWLKELWVKDNTKIITALGLLGIGSLGLWNGITNAGGGPDGNTIGLTEVLRAVEGMVALSTMIVGFELIKNKLVDKYKKRLAGTKDPSLEEN